MPRTPMAPSYISLAYLIYFRMMFYLLPMLAECGRGSISLQSPVTYQVETDQCKRSFESVMPDCYLYSFWHPRDSNSNLFSSITPHILLHFTSKAGSNSLNNSDVPFQVNLLNDDPYRWNCATSTYGQIE